MPKYIGIKNNIIIEETKKLNGVIFINTGFKINQKNDLTYLTIPSFESTGLVKHCVTTRQGGFGSGPFESLNTSFAVGDSEEIVRKNLDTVCSTIGVDYRKLVFSDQVHSDTIKIVRESDIGKGISAESDIKAVDALITNIPGVPMITFYADCVPLIFLDKAKKVIAMAHAGWKGTVLKIGAKTVKRMTEVFGTDPKDCLVGIGPSIEMKCFEVGAEVAERFRESFSDWEALVVPHGADRYLVDLWQANTQALTEVGIPEENITISGFCSKCDSRLFYSYRRDKGVTGRQSAIIELI